MFGLVERIDYITLWVDWFCQQ